MPDQYDIVLRCLDCNLFSRAGLFQGLKQKKIVFNQKKNTTGRKRPIRKTFELKIWKDSLLVEKQTIPQQKALDPSFNLAP